jgi:hypothetical protein
MVFGGVGHEWRSTWFAVGSEVTSTDFLSKSPDHEDSLGGAKVVKVDVVLEVDGLAEKEPPSECQRVLLVGSRRDSVVTVTCCRMEEIFQMTELGGVQMRKLGGSCSGQANWRKDVREASSR